MNPIGKIAVKFRNSKKRKKLKNSDFTIISSNCVGGVIYHDLGLQFKSPTINLWFKPKDYLKFLSDLDKYLEMELSEETDKDVDYPVGLLGDIFVVRNKLTGKRLLDDFDYVQFLNEV